MKILLLDIETAPNIAHVWGLWNQNISHTQLVNSGYVLCWAAKWYQEGDIYFSSINLTSPKRMLREIHRLLDEADVVIHYNGKKFDIPTLNKEFLLFGMTPPAPYKQIDLLKEVRSNFKFVSNKLDYVAKALGLSGKVQHKGHQLWVDCMAGIPEAWEKMEEYNIQDVQLLEEVYDKLIPWIKNHPNRGLFGSDIMSATCPNCSSGRLQRRGWAYTNTYRYQRYQCKDCGKWSRDRKCLPTGDTKLMIGL